MRILAVALILISFCGLPVRAQGVDPGVREKVLSAKAEAIKVMRKFSNNSENDRYDREMTTYIADLLESSSTAPAVGLTLDGCFKHPSVVADTGWISQVIAICPNGLASSRDDLIQTFIHEAYHLYEGKRYMPKHHPEIYEKILINPQYDAGPDIRDESEKRAATIELKIMLKIYGCVFFETTYFDDLLGLKNGTDFVICK